MRSERIYQIRRAILSVCKEYASGSVIAPVKLDDMAEHFAMRRLHPTREELLAEWNGLLTLGFIEALKGSDGEYVKISASGLKQINCEEDRDPYIWGASGLR